MAFIDWIIVAVFLLGLTTIGFVFSRKNRNIEDYFVAGRSMPTWLVALAATGFFTDARDVFPQFIKNCIPTGVRGLMIVGLLAAALSSFNSAINAMASSFVTDLYLPIRKERGKEVKDDASQVSSSKRMAVLMLQPYILTPLSSALFGKAIFIAWPWWCPIGSVVSIIICLMGKPCERLQSQEVGTGV